MALAAFQGFIENGKIVLPPNAHLPDTGRVYILVPDSEEPNHFELPPLPPVVRVLSPRFVNPDDARHFVLDVTPDN